MTPDKKLRIFNETIEYLPKSIRDLLSRLSQKTVNDINEIRLRAGRPLSLTLGGESVFVSAVGNICHLMQHGLYMVSAEEIDETLELMCEHSMYAYIEQIKSGYITLKNGCRAGLAATAVYENGEISGFKSVSSINIRLACEYKNCAMPLSKYLGTGLLIAGPPSSGKTTLLRDAVRLISSGIGTERKRVAVIDSRGEIAALKRGVPQNDVGLLADVINGTGKAEGIEIAIRTLNPQVIAFDEIATKSEADAVLEGLFSGAEVITTAHLGSLSELESRSAVMSLILSGAIKNIAFVAFVGAKPEIIDVSNLNFKEAKLKQYA